MKPANRGPDMSADEANRTGLPCIHGHTGEWLGVPRRACGECKADGHRQHAYRLTNGQYRALRAAQTNSCAICHSAEKRLVIDHDHATDKVRGLLCDSCNARVGFAERVHFGDILAYLEEHR